MTIHTSTRVSVRSRCTVAAQRLHCLCTFALQSLHRLWYHCSAFTARTLLPTASALPLRSLLHRVGGLGEMGEQMRKHFDDDVKRGFHGGRYHTHVGGGDDPEMLGIRQCRLVMAATCCVCTWVYTRAIAMPRRCGCRGVGDADIEASAMPIQRRRRCRYRVSSSSLVTALVLW